MHQFAAKREGILQLLKQALEENQAKEIIERLQWFLHFTEYGSVSGTCRRFRIARSTFYRWQRRFDPNDLSTIADLPPSQGTAIFQGVPAFCRVQQSLAHTVAMTKETSAPSSHICPFCRFWSWIQPLWKRCGRLTVLLSIFLNLALILFMLLPGSAGASSWSPTLLVNTESFQIIDDSDANADIYIQFGDSLSKKLTFERTLDRFNFNDDVYIGGNLGVSGTTSGATVHAQNTLTSSGTLTVNGNAEIRGTLSGANLTVMAGADSYLMGNVGIGTTVPGAKLDARGSAVFNEDSADADFRVEGNNNANLIFADAGNDYVGIGTVPQSHLHVYGSNVEHRIEASNANGDAGISLFSDVDWKIINHGVGSAATVDSLIFWNDTAGAVRFVVDPTGSVGIGDTTPSTKLDVAGGISGTTLKVTGQTTLGNTVNIRGVTYTFPPSDGSASGKVLKTDGSGNLSWSADTGGSSGVSQDDADARYVNVSGDTMTGALSIKKTSGTATGNTLVVDTKGLVYDATNKRVGIGDVTPSNELEVRGTVSGTSLHAHSLLTSSGNVLAAGNITVNSDNGAADAVLTFGNDAAAETLRFNDTTNGFVFSDDVEVQGTLSGANLTVMAGANSYVMGNVGIGTTSPGAKLHVQAGWGEYIRYGHVAEGAGGRGIGVDANGFYGTTFYSSEIPVAKIGDDGGLALGSTYSATPAVYPPAAGAIIQGNVGIGDTTPGEKLEVRGTISGSSLHAHSLLTSSGNVLAAGDMTINSDNGAADAILTFGNDAAAETLRFNDTTNGFEFSDDVEVQGTLSGANLTVMAGANSYVMGNVGIGTTVPGAALDVVGNYRASTNGAVFAGSNLKIDNSVAGAADSQFSFYGNTTTVRAVTDVILRGGNTQATFASAGTLTVAPPNDNDAVRFVVKGATSQTADLQQWQNAAGTVLGVVNSTGNVGIGDTTPSDTLEVRGTASGTSLHAHSLLTSSGKVLAAGDMTINSDNGAADAILTFGNDAAAETLRFNDTTNGFVFSDDVEVQGTLSGANLTVMAGADSYLMGNVGIGTTGPESLLNVYGNSASPVALTITNAGANTADIVMKYATGDGGDIARIMSSVDNSLTIATSQTGGNDSPIIFKSSVTTVGDFAREIMRLTRSGNVGIGDTTPSTKLDVAGGISGTTLKITGHTTLGNTVTIRGVAYTFPASDGSASGKVLKTDGSGNLSWSADTGASSGVSQSEADARYVNVSGDSMTGALTIKKTSGTATGNTLVVDTKGLVYDATNKRVGIGTTSPGGALEVASGNVFIGDTANAKTTQGLTINQAANDDEILSLKSSDVVVPFTAISESDTYGFFRKIDGNIGGLQITGMADIDGTGLRLDGYNGAAGHTASPVIINGARASGTSTATIGDTAPLLSIQNDTADKLTVLGGGNVGIGDTTPGEKLEVRGTVSGSSLHAHSLLTSSGKVLAAGDMTINSDNGAADAILTFGNDAAAETLRFNDTTNGFVFSDDVEVQGTLSGANLTVMAGADSYLMGNVGIGTVSPGSKLDVSGAFSTGTTAQTIINTSVGAVGNIARLDFSLSNTFNGQQTGARIDAYQINAGNTGQRLDFWTREDSGSITRQMVISTAGNVGIGTTSPTTKLEVVGTMSGKALAIHTNQTSKTGALLLNQDGNGTGMLLDSEATNAPGLAISMPTSNAVNNPHLLFGYNGAFDTKLYRSAANTLTPSGHFVPSAHNTFNLGTTSVRWANVYSGPGSFHVGVEGNEARIGFNEEFSELEFDSDGNNTAEVIVDKQGRMGIGARPLTDTLEVEGSAAKSSPGGWRGRSDIRIKKDVQTIENSLDAINALRPVQYRFKPEYLAEHPLIKDTVYYNYIAQEFRNVFPDSVFEDAAGYLQIDSYAVNPYLVGSVQELSARVQALEKRMVSAEGAGSVLTISGGTIEITAGYHLVAMQDGKKNDVLAHIRGGVLGQVLVLQPKDKQKITLRMSGHLLLEEDFQMHNPGDIIVLLKIDDDRWVELTRSKSSGTKLVDIFSGWEQGAFETVDEGM